MISHSCQFCKTEMKLLFNGYYCPQDCDRRGAPPPTPVSQETDWTRLLRKVPRSFRSLLERDRKDAITAGATLWVAYDRTNRVMNFGPQRLTHGSLLYSDWAVMVPPDGTVKVIKNRTGVALVDIPDEDSL